jgi:acetoin utilization deacetylase AcuC-like enzyme
MRAAGILLGGLGVPTVAVQEGGYHLTTLGTLVADCLAGLAEGAQRAASAG